MLCSIDLQFLHCNLPLGSQVGLVLLGHLSSKLILVFLGHLFLVILPVTPGCLLILRNSSDSDSLELPSSGVPALFRVEETDFFETEVVGTASSSTVRKEAS
jgi:hypothetical protein